MQWFSVPTPCLPIVDKLTGIISCRRKRLGIEPLQITQIKDKFGCYDSKTEVLTKVGWKYFKDCTYEDEFATLKSDGYMEYNRATELISYYYSGQMCKIVNRGIDLLVTPDHNLYVAKGGYKGVYKKGFPIRHPFAFKKAIDVVGKPRLFKKSFFWEGENISDIVVKGHSYSNYTKVTGHRTYHRPDLHFYTEKFLPLLGFYVAEGCSNPKKGRNCYSCL